ncbi:DNA-processing protein DprA [Microbacterium sp. ARD31]|uniref:DNA-processing protein DprA n=1 Tax=Microbacterium sp. ARD31 TaxID=2962576 RepID=UPI002881DC4A|nr:DNA-processing protein DprA [Microbacterium sp. ARD31]MDT0181443.1 DNA-processing protein DprA [Microbacterium sp. ARD31]
MNLSDERLARVALSTISQPGDTVTGTLLEIIGAPETLRMISTRDQLPETIDPTEGELWRARLNPRLRDADTERVVVDTERRGLTLLTPDDPRWPTALRALGVASPIALWIAGSIATRAPGASDRVAIVGARAATSYGEHVAAELASELAGSGVSIVSGGAYGIDGAAHRGAIASQPGGTVAILAGGLDRPYPAGNAHLFERIVGGGGALVSELPPGSTPTRWRFMQRNRILAALAGATVVVEAGARSGSLDIAVRAHGLGRSVGAAPGPITSAASAGCHRLLRERIATLVTNSEEVRELLDSRESTSQRAFDRTPSFANRRRSAGLTI